jgi:uncharacterized membrane protein
MNVIDFISFFLIAISYNIFIHQVITTLFRSYSYEDRIEYGITFIFLAGFIGIVLSKIMLKPGEKFMESVTSLGLLIGGLMLILTAVIVNWDNMSDDVRLFFATVVFCGLLYYFYKKNRNSSSNKN